MSSFLAPAMKRLLKPTQKLKPGLLPKNIIPKNKWSVSVLCLLVCALLAVLCCALLCPACCTGLVVCFVLVLYSYSAGVVLEWCCTALCVVLELVKPISHVLCYGLLCSPRCASYLV